jgi:hypothetical protein
MVPFPLADMSYNFVKHGSDYISLMTTGYDYGSVMHYGAKAFSVNGRDTITPLQRGADIGQRRGFSALDIQRVKKLYCETGEFMFPGSIWVYLLHLKNGSGMIKFGRVKSENRASRDETAILRNWRFYRYVAGVFGRVNFYVICNIKPTIKYLKG